MKEQLDNKEEHKDFFLTIPIENKGTDSSCIYNALFELLQLQQFIKNSTIPYFGKLLARLVGVDTIPIMLQTKSGFLQLMGVEKKDGSKEKHVFHTRFFRIEKIDKDRNCAVVSLLRAIDMDGNDTENLCDVIRLKKTKSCETIDLSCICGIQAVDITFLKRKIIIEPKW